MKRFDFELVLIMIRQSILLGTGLHSNNNNEIKLHECWQINMLTEDRYVIDDNDYREYKEDRCHWWDKKERYMTEMAIDQMLMKQNSKMKKWKAKVIMLPYYPNGWGLTCGKNAARAVLRNETDVDHSGKTVEANPWLSIVNWKLVLTSYASRYSFRK